MKITEPYLELSPAYGRNPRTRKDAEADFLEGKDWQLPLSFGARGAYCSIRDFEPGTPVLLRYSRLMSVVSVKVPKTKKETEAL